LIPVSSYTVEYYNSVLVDWEVLSEGTLDLIYKFAPFDLVKGSTY